MLIRNSNLSGRCGGCLLWVLLMHCAATAQFGSVITATQRHVLWSWLAHPPTARSRTPLVVFTTSRDECAPCCAAAVNELIHVSSAGKRPVRALVVVATEVPKEGLALRRLFPNADVAECSGEQLRALLPQSPGGSPSMFIVDTSGEIIARFYHIQTNPPSAALVHDVLEGVGTAVHGVRLQETDSTMVGEAGAPLLSRDGRKLSLLEPRQNTIQTYDARTGSLLSIWAPPSSLGKYYRTSSADTMWEALAQVYSPLVVLAGLVREPGSDTINAMALMFDHWNLVYDAAGRPNAGWQRNISLIRIVDTQWVSVARIKTGTLEPQAPVVSSKWGAVSTGFWTGYTGRRGKGIVDSTYAVVGFALDTPRVFPLLSADALDSLTHGVYNPEIPPMLAALSDTTIAILSTGSRGLARLDLYRDRVALTAIPPTGLLDTALHWTGIDSTRRLEVSDMISANGNLFVVITDNRAAKRSRVVLQSYSPTGEFLSEAIVAQRNARLLACSGAGNDRDAAVLLMKWDDVRWHILPIVQ